MFFDWLTVYQEYDYELPIIASDGYAHFDFIEGEFGKIRQSRVHHEGSYSISIQVHVKSNRVEISGNPSRFNRLDNLFGFTKLDDCIAVYNSILSSLGLPALTKCTFCGFSEHERDDGTVKLQPLVNGAVITAIHVTKNMSVGQGCVDAYLKGLASQSYLRRQGRLHADGKTVDWLSQLGNARELYPSVYDKAHELQKHALPKVKRKFGEQSAEYRYLSQLIDYCKQQEVSRHELKLNSPYLKKHNLSYYGLNDIETNLTNLLNEFIEIDKKLKVSAMNLQTITETLLNEGICTNTKSANATALYAINWLNGQVFQDFSGGQIRQHRMRLRKIGIDIAKPCNLLIFSPVIVKEVVEIHKFELQPPDFYQHPTLPKHSHLRLVA
jgi:hypothetical protein